LGVRSRGGRGRLQPPDKLQPPQRMALEIPPRAFENLPLAWSGTTPGPARRFGFDLIRGDQAHGPIGQTQHLRRRQGVPGVAPQSRHGHRLSRAVRQIPPTFLRQRAVAMTGQRMWMPKESIEHGRTSRVAEMRWWLDSSRKGYVAFGRLARPRRPG